MPFSTKALRHHTQECQAVTQRLASWSGVTKTVADEFGRNSGLNRPSWSKTAKRMPQRNAGDGSGNKPPRLRVTEVANGLNAGLSSGLVEVAAGSKRLACVSPVGELVGERHASGHVHVADLVCRETLELLDD